MNAPESAQVGRPNLKATRPNVDALSKVRQNWYVYFRDGAFTFARYTAILHQTVGLVAAGQGKLWYTVAVARLAKRTAGGTADGGGYFMEMEMLSQNKMARRRFIGVAAGAVASGIAIAAKGETKMKEITLEALPYAEDALAPTISARTVSFHYGKHHAGYVKALNGLIAGTQYEGRTLEEIIRTAAARGDAAIFNNAAQTWNHTFYWNSLAPAGKGCAPSAALLAAIESEFGSFDACKDALADAAIKRFGSGWGWLVAEGGKVSVESTPNAETPITRPGVKPLLVVDVWEHAYYLDWQNVRADYVKAVVGGHLNWNAASRRFAQS